MLLAKNHGNCWYVMSEDVLLRAMAGDWQIGSINETLDRIVGDITAVTGHFLSFLGLTLENAFGFLKDSGCEIAEDEETVVDVPLLDGLQLQFFSRAEIEATRA